MRVKIILTGGTFEKEYDPLSGELRFTKTHVPEMLRMGRCRLDVKIKRLMMIDSLNMSPEDVERIIEHCRRSTEDRIVIIHGTDTMAVTAQHLGRAIKDKTVVLTGAMVPFSIQGSDGLFNLGAALAFVQTLGPGVYVTINGRCFDWYNVTKDRARGEFVERAPAEPARPQPVPQAPSKEGVAQQELDEVVVEKDGNGAKDPLKTCPQEIW